jgi:hypothetical protein
MLSGLSDWAANVQSATHPYTSQYQHPQVSQASSWFPSCALTPYPAYLSSTGSYSFPHATDSSSNASPRQPSHASSAPGPPQNASSAASAAAAAVFLSMGQGAGSSGQLGGSGSMPCPTTDALLACAALKTQ